MSALRSEDSLPYIWCFFGGHFVNQRHLDVEKVILLECFEKLKEKKFFHFDDFFWNAFFLRYINRLLRVILWYCTIFVKMSRIYWKSTKVWDLKSEITIWKYWVLPLACKTVNIRAQNKHTIYPNFVRSSPKLIWWVIIY